MIIFAIYHIDMGFIGFYISKEGKSLSRNFVDVVICNGQQDGCDEITKHAGYNSSSFCNLMEEYGWNRQSHLDDYDSTFIYCAFSRE